MITNKFKYLIKPVFFLITGFCLAQNDQIKEIEKLVYKLELDSAQLKIDLLNESKLSIYEIGQYHYLQGVILKKQDNFPGAFEFFIEAIGKFKAVDSLKKEADSNYQIYDLLMQQNTLKVNPKPFLDKYIWYAKKTNQPLPLARSFSKIAKINWDKNDYKTAKLYYRKSIKQLELIHDSLRIALINSNIGSVNISSNEADSALFYFKKTLPYFIKINRKNSIANNYNNQARAYEILKDTLAAIILYKKALTIELNEYDKKSTVIFLDNLIRCYSTIKDFKNAYKYSSELINLNIKIDNKSQNKALIEAENKYRAAEKEKLRLRNLYISIVLGATLLVVSIFAFLIQKNTKRKQKLAEQEKALETQKLATVLKEQELVSIDAMIEGQEKERQRIANDLHDDLGGLMATVKLHFNVLKDKQTPELFNKTNTLLDEAYQKIRSIAHAKNSGVIAKQGLLKAIQNMTDKVSTSNKIKIEVIDHGLEDRLENSLELTIFRIVQELVTNIIKHAQATEATIHLTNHDDSLNILLEDNGKGFNPSQVTTKNKGMGISSIDKRIEHLNGSMTIESEIDKGTTIIIDIPL